MQPLDSPFQAYSGKLQLAPDALGGNFQLALFRLDYRRDQSPHFVISPKSIENKCIGCKLIFDLSVPRNVDPVIGKKQTIALYNIDQINKTLKARRKKMEDSLYTAEQMVQTSARQHLILFLEKRKYSKVLECSA